jgi:hypothetical protein
MQLVWFIMKASSPETGIQMINENYNRERRKVICLLT